ncbi:hypothetical protein GCM10007939_21670 [Amylibacter marinus]|uniref:TPR repeat n=1 Tax=Amylibacter marinus TaxID=1475483 RepID=A0ABQ5VX82_9RHOB|nr:tetratricopeptide repeat protein [Amylibacter marinus]GLQ35883.1 hypothetical protein GCM10007939_21670 [Amylibacter marinus]
MRYFVIIFALFSGAQSALCDTERGIQLYNNSKYAEAEQQFLGPVAAGDPVAIRYYANMLYTGRGVAIDRFRAKQLLRDAYAQGDRASGVYLAGLLTEFMLHFGRDEQPADEIARLKEATALYEETYTGPNGQKPATKIVNNASSTKGVVQPKESILIWFERAVQEGHGDSAWFLAQAHGNGNGVPRDMGNSFYWAEFAAFLGHAEAQAVVGQAYIEGRFDAPNPAFGMGLIMQSAKERHNPAMLMVAEYYASVEQNFGMAWRVLHLAYDRGMEKSERSKRLEDYLRGEYGNSHAESIDDYAYSGYFETLIQKTEPDYIAARDLFSARIRPFTK